MPLGEHLCEVVTGPGLTCGKPAARMHQTPLCGETFAHSTGPKQWACSEHIARKPSVRLRDGAVHNFCNYGEKTESWLSLLEKDPELHQAWLKVLVYALKPANAVEQRTVTLPLRPSQTCPGGGQSEHAGLAAAAGGGSGASTGEACNLNPPLCPSPSGYFKWKETRRHVAGEGCNADARPYRAFAHLIFGSIGLVGRDRLGKHLPSRPKGEISRPSIDEQ